MNILKALLRPKVIPYQFHYEGILGTSASLRFDCLDAELAEKACDSSLEHIAHLETIFSSYNPKSTLMEWHGTQTLPRELCSVLDHAEEWRIRTGDAFASDTPTPITGTNKDISAT